MMFRNRVRVHGEYIHDHSRILRREREIEETEAVSLLRESKYVNRRFDPNDPNWFLNKGFVVLSTDGDKATILYRHDFSWSLWSGAVADALRAVHRSSLDDLLIGDDA